MGQTLKDNYRRKQVTEIMRRADRQLMLENKQAQLLIEAMNDQDLQKASDIIDKLRGLKGKGIKALDSALEQAESQLNRYTAGGPLTKAWTKLKGVVGLKNPLVKFMTLANALETGFKQIPTILKNNLGGIDLKANADKTIAQLVPDQDKQKTITDNMRKALSPKGIFGVFKKVPYVDTEELTQNLLNVPIKNIGTTLQQINSGPNSEQVATDLKDTATAQGGVETKGTTGGTPAQATTGTQTTTPAKSTTAAQPSAPTGETPERQPGAVDVNQVLKSLSKKAQDELLGTLGKQGALNVLKVLADDGKLKV